MFKQKSSNEDAISKKKKQIYQSLKKWDTKRGSILEFHFKMVIHIIDKLDEKIKTSKQYLNYIESLMIKRLKQIDTYIVKGITKSDFVLASNQIKSYELHHQLLKQLMLHQSQKELQYEYKHNKLKLIFNQFKQLKEITSEQNNNMDNNQSSAELQQQSSLIMLKCNVRELIDCDLPELIAIVTEKCKKVSHIYNQQSKQDLYLAINEFIDHANRQYILHKKIGRELIYLLNSFVERDKDMNIKLKQTLVKWLHEQQQLSQEIGQQLVRKNDNPLIEDYYNIEDMVEGFSSNHHIQYFNLKEFIVGFQIESFTLYNDLILCQFQAFYNKQIQTTLIITIDNYVHLKRATQSSPDFTFFLQKGLQFRKINDFSLDVCQKKRNFIFKTEKQFEFTIEFNSEQDIQHFRKVTERISECIYL